ncbi:acyl-CoA dehydrogenase family protein [Paenibacillus sp. HB172176]|uniref:acyl-CoA dehydrogenase family protein n=1 Tax=Paenibacillus sp. HB172176 TaxID=2493690 RepID=UPI00143B1825|nr:acyl-CoA dehydrogenase family protein [Paenibacillus sp. HB172176]
MNRISEQYIRTREQQERLSKAGELASIFAARAEVHDRDGSFPFDNFADLREAGFYKLTIPKKHGGDEISLYELVQVQERLAYGDGSTALSFGWHLGQMLHFGSTDKWNPKIFAELCRSVAENGAMINTFASEAASGSPSRGGKPGSIAVPVSGGWRISGRKTFSTLSPILDQFVVTAYLEEEACIGSFLVKRGDGIKLVETWDTLGMRATGSHDMILEDVFVPHEMRLADSGIDDGGGWLLHIPACYLGIAMAARDFALDFARAYKPGQMKESIASLPSVQQSIGEMEVELRTARCLLYDTADRWDRQADSRSSMKPELGLAKYVATNHAIKVVDIAMRIVGGASLSRKLPLERYYRDVRAGLHNPPMDNSVISLLAAAALAE